MDKKAGHRWSEKFPELGTGPISTESYISEDIFERERELVFKNTWLKVGRVEEIPDAGCYKVKRIAIAKTSVIVIRGKDDVIRAFHNQCSHRANKVVDEVGDETFGKNRAAVMTCRFHGWVYNAEGRVIEMPAEERFFSCFDKDKNGLATVHCEVWAGFIFINLAQKPKASLSEFLGAYGKHFVGFPYDKLSYCFTYQTYLNANWKIGVDAFAEAYHVPTIHAGTFPIGSIDMDDVQLFGDHRTCALFHEINDPPTRIATIAQRVSRTSLVDLKRSGASHLPANINPRRDNKFSFELSVMFPNFLLHVTDGIWFTHQFWPVSVNRTLWEGKYYVAPPKSHSERWGVEHSQILQRNAWLEDTATMEATQEAAESRAKDKMYFQDDEVLLRHGYHVLEKYIGAKLGAPL